MYVNLLVLAIGLFSCTFGARIDISSLGRKSGGQHKHVVLAQNVTGHDSVYSQNIEALESSYQFDMLYPVELYSEIQKNVLHT